MVLDICPACGSNAYKKLYSLPEPFSIIQCKKCALAKLYPMPTHEDLENHYQNCSSKNYSLEITKFRDLSLRDLVNKIVLYDHTGSGRWLDLGCFDGGLLNFAKSKGYQTFGIDMQRSAVEVARAEHGIENIVQSDNFKGHFPAKSMRIVSAISVIEHLLEPENVFTAAREYLSDDGVLTIQTPIITSLPSRVMRSYWPCIAAPEHTYYFSDNALACMAAKYNFKIVKTFPHIKRLPVDYCFHQLQYFGQKLYKKIAWIQKILPPIYMYIYVYIGEKIYIIRPE